MVAIAILPLSFSGDGMNRESARARSPSLGFRLSDKGLPEKSHSQVFSVA